MTDLHVVELHNWSIITNLGYFRSDHLALCGIAVGHPSLNGDEQAIPGTFTIFDSELMIGVSKSGTRWKLMDSFRPNGNASTLESAIAFIQENWVVGSIRF